jgi:hypothetical protein
VVVGQVTYSPLAEKGAKIVVFWYFSEKCLVGVPLGCLVCF